MLISRQHKIAGGHVKNFLRTLLFPPSPWRQTQTLTDAERVALWKARKANRTRQEAIEHIGRSQNFDRHAADRVRPATAPRLPRELVEETPWIAI